MNAIYSSFLRFENIIENIHTYIHIHKYMLINSIIYICIYIYIYIYWERQIDRQRLWGRKKAITIIIIMIISECSKLAQKEYKARHNWVGKVIHWEMCKKFKFGHTNKWYMHNPAPVLENDSDKLPWDFNIQTDHLIPARRPDLIIINKKKRAFAKLSTLLFWRTTE